MSSARTHPASIAVKSQTPLIRFVVDLLLVCCSLLDLFLYKMASADDLHDERFACSSVCSNRVSVRLSLRVTFRVGAAV